MTLLGISASLGMETSSPSILPAILGHEFQPPWYTGDKCSPSASKSYSSPVRVIGLIIQNIYSQYWLWCSILAPCTGGTCWYFVVRCLPLRRCRIHHQHTVSPSSFASNCKTFIICCHLVMKLLVNSLTARALNNGSRYRRVLVRSDSAQHCHAPGRWMRVHLGSFTRLG